MFTPEMLATIAQVISFVAPQSSPQRQPGKQADSAAMQSKAQTTARAGGSAGDANNTLTGNQGVDPALLALGKNTLLGS